MANLTFKNLMDMKIFNNRRVAIYYLNNLHPQHEYFNLEDKDFIKKLIATSFICEDEIRDEVIKHFNTILKTKPFVQKLATQHFIHKENHHTFSL